MIIQQIRALKTVFVSESIARLLKFALIGMVVVPFSGCSPSFHDLGVPPTLTPSGEAIAIAKLSPMATPKPIKVSNRYTMANNSFWDGKDGIYFRDSRAYEVGDILTVKIVMNESAKFKNRSDRDTTASGGITADTSFSLAGKSAPVLTADSTGGLNTKLERGGSVNRSEVLRLSVAAVVIEAAENGNLFVHGTQEVRVNHELRVLTVQGFVRSRDILPDNTIAYDKIAEARISYGGGNTRKNNTLYPQKRRRRASLMPASDNWTK